MKDSTLVKFCRHLTKNELRGLRKVVRSPYFNQRDDVIRLLDFLIEHLDKTDDSLHREAAFRYVFPEKTTFEMPLLRHASSFLLETIRSWLAIEEMRRDGSRAEIYLQQAYKRLGADEMRQRELPENLARHADSPLRDARFHHQLFQIRLEEYDFESKQNRATEQGLQPLLHSLTTSQVSTLLRMGCLVRAFNNFSGKNLDLPLLAAALDLVENAPNELGDEPSVMAWFHTYRCLESPENEAHFQAFKQLLPQVSTQFSSFEVGDLYLSAINFCIRRANEGRPDFLREAFQLYQSGFATRALLADNKLSKYTYKNAANLGLHLGEFDWVQRFLDDFKPFLAENDRESLYKLSRAKASFLQKNYDDALLFLQEVALSEETLYNLDARRMLVRIFYEQRAFSALESQLESYTAYLRRHKEVGYHRENHQNFIGFVRKMMRADLKNKVIRQRLRLKIEAQKSVLEKTWLIEQLQ